MSERGLELVEIYRARNLPEAHVIRLLMEREGIDVSISNEMLQGIVGEIAMGWSTSPRLLVKQQDAERARTLLASHLDHASRPDVSIDEETLTCLACGTPMHDDLVCSACGWTYGGDQTADTATSVTSSESTPSGIAVKGTQDRANDLPLDDFNPVLSNEPLLPVRTVWFEVAAVMCIGFVPHLANAVLTVEHSEHNDPYWLSAAHLIATAFSSTFATLYVIHRSGEKWREFGYGRLRFTDFIMAFVLTMLIWYFGAVLQLAIASRMVPVESVYRLPETSVDYFLMLIMYGISALSEEVIMRSYLMTRLRHLLHRPWLSVVISSFLFALYHCYQGFAGFANALFVGLLLGSVFAIYPRIWPLVISHAMTNILLELDATRPPFVG